MKALLSLTVLLTACGGTAPVSPGPTHVDIPVLDTTPRPRHGGAHRESPPPASAAKEAPFPKVARSTLANGLGVAVVEAHALPIVELRVSVRAGTGYAGAPAVADLTAQLLKDGGTRAMTAADLLEKVESLGATLSVDTTEDASTLGLGVTKDRLEDGLALLAQIVEEPRFDGGELTKLKSREADEAAEKARGDGTWTATRVAFHELFPAASPYATYEATAAEIGKVTGAAVAGFHRRFYVPKATLVVVAGDVDPGPAQAAVERSFGTWKGGDPPALDFPAPRLPDKRRILVADRPKSSQSDVYVVSLAPERKSAEWPAVRVANQVLGGGVAGRLFQDVREQRSLAYSTRSTTLDLAHDAVPVLAYAGTQTPKTADAVQGLLDNVDRIAKEPPSATEVDAARRYLSDIFAVRMETVGAIADMVVLASSLGLPDGYWDAYRREVRQTTPDAAARAASDVFRADRALVVVAGDAEVIAPPLARFGEVTVVDPEHGFAVTKTIPQHP
jgi:zinc protease